MATSGGAQARKAFTFERTELQYYPEWALRPNTQCIPLDMNFIFLNGGAGDYISWLRSIQWLAECATWINGTLIHPIYLDELVSYALAPYPRWKHATYKSMNEIPGVNEKPFRGPVNLQTESLNATGAHLFTCGWVYYTNKERAPEGVDQFGHPWNAYMRLDQNYLNNVVLPQEASALTPKRYVVVTTGVTTDTRRTEAKHWNPIIEHVVARGLTPVFLGKSVVETGNAANIHTQYHKDVRYDLGLDLRDKTTLMQAAAIMSRAACVVGLDNGLLHLAGTTEVPIVFGYTLASPEHREPLRPKGRTYNVLLEKGELGCYHCQSRVNFIVGYNFRQCFYSDLACIDLLFNNGCQRWLNQIDLALKEAQ